MQKNIKKQKTENKKQKLIIYRLYPLIWCLVKVIDVHSEIVGIQKIFLFVCCLEITFAPYIFFTYDYQQL